MLVLGLVLVGYLACRVLQDDGWRVGLVQVGYLAAERLSVRLGRLEASATMHAILALFVLVAHDNAGACLAECFEMFPGDLVLEALNETPLS